MVKTPKPTYLSPLPSTSPSLTPATKDRKKNLDSLFGWHSSPYVVSHFCSILKQRLPTGIDLDISTHAIMSKIQDMVEEGHLPKDAFMEEAGTHSNWDRWSYLHLIHLREV